MTKENTAQAISTPSGVTEMPQPKTERQNTYTLRPEETARLKELVEQLNTAKLQVYEANIQLEELQKKTQEAVRNVEAAQRLVSGAVAMLCSSQGYRDGQISPDLKTLTATVL